MATPIWPTWLPWRISHSFAHIYLHSFISIYCLVPCWIFRFFCSLIFICIYLYLFTVWYLHCSCVDDSLHSEYYDKGRPSYRDLQSQQFWSCRSVVLFLQKYESSISVGDSCAASFLQSINPAEPMLSIHTYIFQLSEEPGSDEPSGGVGLACVALQGKKRESRR